MAHSPVAGQQWIARCRKRFWLAWKGGDEKQQTLPEPVEQEREVLTGGGQNGIDGVALLPGEVVEVHMVFGLDMADDGISRGAATHLALGAGVTRRFRPAVKILNLCALWPPYPASAIIRLISLPMVLFHVRNHGGQRVTGIGIDPSIWVAL